MGRTKLKGESSRSSSPLYSVKRSGIVVMAFELMRSRLLAHTSTFAGHGVVEQLEVLWLDLADLEDERVHGTPDRGARCGCGG